MRRLWTAPPMNKVDLGAAATILALSIYLVWRAFYG